MKILKCINIYFIVIIVSQISVTGDLKITKIQPNNYKNGLE